MIRFHWHYNSDPETHTTDLELPEGSVGEAEIKELIALDRGDRCLAQYLVITHMERAQAEKGGES